MNVSVILAHPDPQSFNHAIAKSAVAALKRNGHRIHFHDLYAERFDPLLPAEEIPKVASLPQNVKIHCAEIASADGIVVVHPNWWGQPPAILKGWIDRVIRPGVAYEFIDGDQGEGVPVGLLKAKTAIVFNTANTPSERERARRSAIRLSLSGKTAFSIFAAFPRSTGKCSPSSSRALTNNARAG